MSSLVPEGWRAERLGDVSSLITKGTTPKTYTNEGVNFIKVESISTNRTLIMDKFSKVDLETHNLQKRSQLESGDILFSIAGSLGRIAVVRSEHLPANTNQALALIRLKDGDIDNAYCIQQLSAGRVQSELKNLQTVGAQPNLSLQQVSDLLINCPPLSEQKKIASILTSVDEVIENTQKQIDKLQDLKKATMNELLTKGIGHTEFKDSELGRIPKSWEIQRISELSSLVTNGFVGSASSHYRETGIPYLVSKNIRDNFIDERGLTYISREFHEKTSKSKLVQGDLLTVQSGHVGSSAVVTGEYAGANCHALILTRFNRNSINSNFMAYYLNSALGRLRLSIYFVGSTIVHLNTSDLKKFAVPVPTLREQENIISIVDSIQNQIDDQLSKLHKTQSLKKSLMQDLLTGKVRVTVN